MRRVQTAYKMSVESVLNMDEWLHRTDRVLLISPHKQVQEGIAFKVIEYIVIIEEDAE